MLARTSIGGGRSSGLTVTNEIFLNFALIFIEHICLYLLALKCNSYMNDIWQTTLLISRYQSLAVIKAGKWCILLCEEK